MPEGIVIIQIGMNKYPFILILLSTFLLAVCNQECFGTDCSHNSVTPAKIPVDPVEISKKIQEELKRQHWYYLRFSRLLYQANINLPGRLIIFYFHRNIVGTFFSVCSWNENNSTSQVNTLVRLGNGYSTDISTQFEPVNIDPFIITLDIGGDETVITLNENQTLTIDGKEVDLQAVTPSDKQVQCMEQSDSYLRKTYWYYLNGAALLNKTTLPTSKRVYALLTYSNIVGTFLVITSCEEEVVKANTFVRLGAGSTNAKSVILEPSILQFLP